MNFVSDDDDDSSVDRKKLKKQVLDQMVEQLWNVGNSDLITQVPQQLPPDFMDEIDEEFGDEYKSIQIPEQMNIDLIHMTSLQKAKNYKDQYPFLYIRKQILIIIQTFSHIAYRISKNKLFEAITLIIIVINSILLSIQYTDQEVIELTFLILYYLEAAIKIIGCGLIFNNGAYLRNGWNIIDALVIIAGSLQYFMSSSIQLSALRSLRVLRPIKTISSIKSLKQIMTTFFLSFSELGNALLILGFTYIIFAIIGLQLFSGYSKYYCFNEIGIVIPDKKYCQSCTGICGKMLDNPKQGYLSFDNFGVSLLQVFIISNLEGWVEIMSSVLYSFSQFAVIYFILLIILSAYFLINLTLAILKVNFSKSNQIEEITIEEVSYNYRQLKRLNIYKPANEIIKRRQQFQRSCSIRRSRVIRSLQPKQPTFLENSEAHINSVKLPFKPLLIKDYSKPKVLKHRNTSITLHGIIGVKSDDQKKPSSQQQQKNNEIPQLNRRATQRNILKRGTSYIGDNPLFELEQMLQAERNPRQTLAQQKLIRDVKLIQQQFQKTPGLVNAVNQAVRKSRIEQEQQQEVSALSVSLTEIESIDNEQIKERFQELDIHYTEEEKKEKPQIQQQKSVIKKQKKNDHQKQLVQPEFSKEDEKLKIRLFEASLIPRVVYKEYHSESKNDVLPSFEKKLLLLELHKREEKRKNMKFQIHYHLTILEEKKFEKKERGITFDSSKESSNRNLKIFPDTVVRTPSRFAKQNDGIAKSPSSWMSNNRQKQYGKSYFFPQQRYSIKKLQEIINTEVKDDKLSQRIEEVETKKPLITIPKEEIFHDSIFYQQYHKLKIDDSENQNGTLEAEASILDIKAQTFDPYQGNKLEIIINSLNYTLHSYLIYMSGVLGIIKLFRYKLGLIINTNFFEYLINIFVLANTVVLSLDGLVKDTHSIDQLNYFFTILFASEQLIKIFTNGVSKYSKDIMNLFDLLIVLLSLIDLFYFSSGAKLQAFRSLRLFRAFRIFRVTKLVRSLAYTNFLLQILSNAFYSLLYVTFLLFLFIYIYTLLGMSFFQGSLTYTNYRTSFDTFLDSLLIVTQILILQWIDVLYELLLSNVNNGLVISYLLSWIFIGNYVLLNLLMASLLNYFEEEFNEESTHLQKPQQFQVTVVDKVIEQSPEQYQLFQKDKTIFSHSSSNDMHMSTIRNAFTTAFETRQCYKSLFLFTESNIIRIICLKIINHKIFNLFIFFVICFSTLKLILDTYFLDLLPLLDIFITIIFLIEMVLKIIGQGFITEPNTYMRNTWNIIDFIIIVISLIDIPYTDKNLSFVKILRLLRTLRPLRLLKENKQLKLLVTTLLNSFSGVLNVTLIIFLVFIMFGILGVSLLQGRMFYCEIETKTEFNYFTEEECLELHGQWKNRQMNFDNVFNAILTLFILSRRDDWDKQIYWYIDATDNGPQRNAQLWIIVYFLIFIYTGSILLMDLFTGVIFVNYKFAEFSMKDKIMSADQEDWISIQKLVINSNPNFALYYPPKNKFRELIFKLISNKYFDGFIIIIIIANIIILSLTSDDSSNNSSLETLNLCFNFIFIGESILKLTSYGGSGYFRNTWNQFDFFVVLTSILDVSLKLSGANNQKSFLSSGPQLFRVFRVLRVTKLFRLVKSLKGLKKLVDTAAFALPELLEVILLMLLMYCMFAILAVFLYSDIKNGTIIDDTYNFSDFHHALLTLFRCTTGEQQYGIIFDVMNSHGSLHCLFFIVFSIAMQRIILNLFILIVIQQYEKFFINSDNPLQRFKEFEQDFIDGWAPLAKQFDGHFITVKQLIPLMLTIKSPLGYDLQEKLQLALEDWKKFNADIKQTQQNIERISGIVTAESKRKVATQIMTMEMTATNEGHLEYHYVFFVIMKMFQQNFTHKSSKESKQKVKYFEEQTLQKIRKNRIYINGVNPCVQILYVMMCFKGLRRFSQKVQDKEKKKAQEFSEQSSDSYYCYSSSEIAQREPASILSNTSRESYNQFCTPPDMTVYQSEVNINSNKTSLIQLNYRQSVSSESPYQ